MGRPPEQHRYAELCAVLAAQSLAARRDTLRALCAAGTEEPHVLFLLQWRWALPPELDRDRSGERIGRFTLCEPIDEGGGGIVYRAEQPIGPYRREVAVKLLHPTLLETAREEAQTRFLAEMGTLVKLEHEGIARLYDGGLYEDPATHDQLPYLAMELVRGGLPLTTYAKDYALAWPERLALFLRVCRAVQYAHEHRVVHRDLKPANILVDSDGRPVIIDFGLAQAYDALLPGPPLAASGTPAYMSPEQVSDVFGAVSAKSDVYALGLILYELLAGQLPYTLPHDGAVEQLRQVILEATPPPLSQYNEAYSGALEAIVAAALTKRPADRLSVAVLHSRLERSFQMLLSERDRPRHATRQAPRDLQTGAPPPPVPPAQSTVLPPGAGTPQGPDTAMPDSLEAERRQVTVLFCDLVGSTALSGQLDPEDLREVLRAYRETCAAVIARFGGHIDTFLGDGALVCFGYPQAHEDDPQRAVRAALGIVETVARVNTRLAQDWGVQLAVRIGIHTGLVVAGALGVGGTRDPQAIVGEAPNMAARLQELAASNTVVCSAATARLVDGYFTLEALGPQVLKGVTAPVPVYRVVGESAVRTRLDIAVTRGLTPLVGREPEVALLQERWAQVKDGRGQVVLLSGEGGIGKSRLVQAFTAQLTGEAYTRIVHHCSPYYQQSAFYPVVDLLQRLLQLRTDDPSAEKLRKLEAALRTYDFALEEVVPLLATLLGLPLPERYLPLTLTPQRQKQRTLEILLAWLLKEAERRPVCVVMEDLHWGDPSTLEWLGLLITQIPMARVLLLLLFRPEFQPPWAGRSYMIPLALSRLSSTQTAAMIAKVVGGKRLPAEVVQHLVATTDGVPLFVEELTKMVLESGLVIEQEGQYELVGPLPPLAIPTTLHDSLMMRLDRLGAVKQVAQLGAVAGREFAYEVLQAIASVQETTLQQGLARLVEAELIYQHGVPPRATYRFKHALIQEAAYTSLLRSTRQQLHARIATVLEARFPDMVETQPELLAHHYTAAALNEPAIRYWQQAGEKAIQRSAHVEAIAHLTKGLALVRDLPDTSDHALQELTLQQALGVSLLATKGFAAPEVEAAYKRARALCQKVEDIAHIFPVLFGLYGYYHVRMEWQTARELAEELLTRAQHQQDPGALLIGHYALGNTLSWIGEFVAARAHLEQGMALYDVDHHHTYGFHYGQDPLMGCRVYAARVLWVLGYPDQALQLSEEAITGAQQLAQPYSQAFAFMMSGSLHALRREWQAVQQQTATAIALCTKHGFTHLMLQAMSIRNRALIMQGDKEATARVHQPLRAIEETGARTRTGSFALMALSSLVMGQGEEALDAIDKGLVVSEETGERWYDAELYRLKGESLLALSGAKHTEAATCFQQALDLSRAQQAKSWELRAAMSMSRLWQRQGKRDKAREVLAPICGWFTEGFDTADLQEAKALLAELET